MSELAGRVTTSEVSFVTKLYFRAKSRARSCRDFSLFLGVTSTTLSSGRGKSVVDSMSELSVDAFVAVVGVVVVVASSPDVSSAIRLSLFDNFSSSKFLMVRKAHRRSTKFCALLLAGSGVNVIIIQKDIIHKKLAQN